MFVHAAVEIRKHRGRNTGTTVFLDSFCPTMVPVRVSRVYPECVQAPPGVFLPVPPVSFYRTGTVTGTTSDQIHVLGCGNMDPSSVGVGFGGTPSLVRMLWYMCEGFNAYIRHHDLTAL